MNIHQIKTKLQTTFTSPNREQRTVAQQYLRARYNNPQFILTLIQLITQQPSFSINKAASIQLKTIFNTRLINAHKNQVKRYAQVLFLAIKNPKTATKSKKLLFQPLCSINFLDFTHQIQQALKKYIVESTQRSQLIKTDLYASMIFMQSIIEAQSNESYLLSSLKQFINIFDKILGKILKMQATIRQQGLSLLKLISSKSLISRSKEVQQSLLYKSNLLNQLSNHVINNVDNITQTQLLQIQILNKFIQVAKNYKNKNQTQNILFNNVLLSLYHQFYRLSSYYLQNSQSIPFPILQFFTKIYSFHLLQSDIHPHYQQLLFTIIIPILKTSPHQFQLISEKPSQFINFTNNVIHQHIGNNQKIGASKVLQTITDNMHGSHIKLAQFCISNIRNCLLKQRLGQSMQMRCMSEQQRVDACLMALTITSYNLSKRNDIIKAYQVMLQKCQQAINNFNQVLYIRLIFFICYHLQNLYKEKQDFFYIRRFLKLLDIRIGLCLRLVVIDLLQNAICDQLYNKEMQHSISTFLSDIVSILALIQPQQMFTMIGQIIKYYSDALAQQTIYKLFQKIIPFIQQQNQLCCKQRTRDSNKLYKIINIILQVCETVIVTNFWTNLQKYLQPLIMSLAEPHFILYQDQILQALSKSINKNQSTTIIQLKPIQFLQPLFIKNKQRLGFLFQYINLAIKYNQHKLPEIIIKGIIKISFKIIKNHKLHFYDLAQGYMLLHLLIAIYPAYFQQEQTKILLSNIDDFLYKVYLQQQQQQFQHRICGLAMLLISNQPKLLDFQNTRKCFLNALGKLSNPKNQYDAKLLMINCATILCLRDQSRDTTSLLLRSICSSIYCLRFTKQQCIQNDPLTTDCEDLQKLMSEFYNPFLRVDEFQLVRKMISKYEQSGRIQELVYDLSQKQKNDLGMIIQTQRIDKGSVRRIVHIKRK